MLQVTYYGALPLNTVERVPATSHSKPKQKKLHIGLVGHLGGRAAGQGSPVWQGSYFTSFPKWISLQYVLAPLVPTT